MQPSAEKNLSAARGAFQIGGQEPISSERGHRAATSSAPRTRLCSVLFERWCVRASSGRGIHQHQLHPPTGRVMRMQCMQVGLLFWGAIGAKGAEFSGQVAGEGVGSEQELYVKGSERRGEMEGHW
jgi:hypothetical protein